MPRKNIVVTAGESPTPPVVAPLAVLETCLLFSRADRQLRHLLAMRLKRCRLSFTQWLVLGSINRSAEGGIAYPQIISELGIAASQLSSLLPLLENRKLIRFKTVRGDHRQRRVVITGRGRIVFEDGEEEIRTVISELRNKVPANHFRLYRQVLEAMASLNVSQHTIPPRPSVLK